jgi:hypothetical protein
LRATARRAAHWGRRQGYAAHQASQKVEAANALFIGLRFSRVRLVEIERICGLDGRVKLRRVTSLLARTIALSFATAERHVITDPGGRQIDHHHPGFGIALEMARMFQARRANARREPERRRFGCVCGLRGQLPQHDGVAYVFLSASCRYADAA